MKLLRQLLILLLTIVLPVQGIAGVGMSMSMCSMDMAAQSVVGNNDVGVHDAMAAACHHHTDEGITSGMDDSTSASDNCPHCFALAHFIAAPTRVFLRECLPDNVIVLHCAHFSSHIPLPPLRPPLSPSET